MARAWATASTAPPNSTEEIDVRSPNTVTVAASASVPSTLFVLDSGGTVSISSGQTLTVGNGAANGLISGSGALTESGVGNSLTLIDNNSYSGGTTITGGTIVVTNVNSGPSNNLGSGGLTFNGGTLQDNSDIGQAQGYNAQTFSGSITVNSTGGTISQLGVPGNTITLTGALTGTGTLTTEGSDLILNPSSGNNTVSAINVVSGRLFVFNSGAINYNSAGGVAVTVQSGAILDFQSGAPTPLDSLTFNSGAGVSSRSGTLTLSTANVTFPSAGTIIFDEDDDASENIIVNGTYPALTGALTIQIGSINALVGTVTMAVHQRPLWNHQDLHRHTRP